jgi:hypothetical protein
MEERLKNTEWSATLKTLARKGFLEKPVVNPDPVFE